LYRRIFQNRNSKQPTTKQRAEILKDSPKVPILLLTLYLTPQITKEARKAGIRATLSKTATNHLVGGIAAVLRDEELELKN